MTSSVAGPRGILSRHLIRDQALSIIDEEGVDALTMRRLADRLGVKAQSLYSHFPNKDAVLDAVANRLATSINPNNFDSSWQDGLRTWATSYYDVIHWHPNAAHIVAVGASDRVEYLAVSTKVHENLMRHGWPPHHATMVAAAVTYLVLGAATTHFATANDDADARHHSHLEDATAGVRVARSIDRESFALALDSLIRGLEPVLAACEQRISGANQDHTDK